MQRYDYTALNRDFIDTADFEPRTSGPGSVASTISSASDHLHDEYKAKYERLQESYKRLQRNNISLEEKLLNISEKFNADKNLLSRDLATQTQKVVEAKLTIQQLNKENFQLKSDLKVALQLLQNKPNAFVHQKLANLPTDLQVRVRDYYRDQEREKVARSAGQRISVAVSPSASNKDTDDAISAAILAKVLEQRERERSKDKKFCIDIGTQTHAWVFPDSVTVTDKQRGLYGKSTDEEGSDLGVGEVGYVLDDTYTALTPAAGGHESGDSRGGGGPKSESSKSQSWESDFDSESSYKVEHVSNLLLASVIQSAPEDGEEPTNSHTTTSSQQLQQQTSQQLRRKPQQSLPEDVDKEELSAASSGGKSKHNVDALPAQHHWLHTNHQFGKDGDNGIESNPSTNVAASMQMQPTVPAVMKRSYTYDYLTSQQVESTPPYRAKPTIPSSSSVFQDARRLQQGLNICRIPENCMSSSSIPPSDTLPGNSSGSGTSSRDGSLTGAYSKLMSGTSPSSIGGGGGGSGSSSVVGSRLTRSMSYSTKQTDL